MTLGTNATLEEQIKYAPQEADYDFILDEIKELEEWRDLLNVLEYSPDDVKQRISEQDDEICKKDRDIEDLEAEVDALCMEVRYLNNRVEELVITIEEYEAEIERLKETIDDLTSSD